MTSRSDLTEGERDHLDVLGDLVHHHETTEHPIPSATDTEILRDLMDAHGLNQVQLAAETGITVSILSEVLSGKRGLSKGNIGTLSRFFHVGPAVSNFGWRSLDDSDRSDIRSMRARSRAELTKYPMERIVPPATMSSSLY